MNKKILIPALLTGVIFTMAAFKESFKSSKASSDVTFDYDIIQALSHKNSSVVSFVNSDIAKYWDSEAGDYENLKTLYENNTEIASFPDFAYDHKICRDLYARWDDFKPVNNTLTWKSNVEATSYDVVVSLKGDLTEAIYETKGLLEESYTMVNPYSNTHYFWQVTANTTKGKVKSGIFDFYSADYKRTLDIPGVSNTRDIGGFTSSLGGIKQGLVYRSARLDDIAEEGIQVLKNLDIQTDLDVRNKAEGAVNPANLTNYYNKTLQLYSDNFKEEYRPAMIEAVRVFADPNNYPIIFHCSVGRDRTGTLDMLLQSLMGASKEYIIHDYYTSMWSVTGAYQKTVEDLNYGTICQFINGLESLGSTLEEGAVNYLKQIENEETHELIGLTAEEIQSIRDILSGKTEITHGVKPFKPEDNYEGKALVKFESIGNKDVGMMVDVGTTITAPYELKEGMTWYSNQEVFDFATPITDATYIYADYLNEYAIRIHFVGIAREDEILNMLYGKSILLSDYGVDGYNMLVISDTGEEITKFTVRRDTVINILYTKIK